MAEVDVVVVGASVAGCTTATLMARQGLSVALLEKAPDAGAYKRLCTHELVGAAEPVFERLGIVDELDAVAGDQEHLRIWTRYGWTKADFPGRDRLPRRNIRRQTLDPILRRTAAGTDGVELMLGATATGLVTDAAGRPSGVRYRGRDGHEESLEARLVVGADGRDSKIARLANVPARVRPHGRFGYAALFDGVKLSSGKGAQMWLCDPDVGYAFPTDGGLTVLALMRPRNEETLAPFKADLEGAFRGFMAGLPDAPDLSGAERRGTFMGALKVRNARRPASAPGVAFVGDAAQVSDYLYGTGCGFALLSGSWLADTVGPVLAARADDATVDGALVRYRRLHRRRLAAHHWLISDYSTGRRFSPIEKLLYSAATHHDPAAEALSMIASRDRAPHRVLTPSFLARTSAATVRRALVAG